jgi:hypothetical protein
MFPCIPDTNRDLNTNSPRHRRSTVRLAPSRSERIVPERAVLNGMQAFLTRCTRCDVHRQCICDWFDDVSILLEG